MRKLDLKALITKLALKAKVCFDEEMGIQLATYEHISVNSPQLL
jgi:hypothetical protein